MDVSQYHIQLEPGVLLSNRLSQIQVELEKHIGAFVGLKSKPHLTIGSVRIHASKEMEILNRLRYVCQNQSPIRFEVNGFGSFEPHTLYLSITDKSEIRTLMQNCQHALDGLSSLGWYPRKKNPHITIARELNSKFELAKRFFEIQSIHADCHSNSLEVFRRSKEGLYELVEIIPFEHNKIE